MRPVRLDLDGFATFRTLAVIDFTDADFFALVGATGAGKSTIIDAITFALYGTVPRWDDQRMITPALAPTATRGVVRLIFDADGRRYVVAREVRRSGGRTSRVTMHGSRLEYLVDPTDLDGPTDVLASDSEVTGAVEKLLGLSYQHFTTCVALPQGQFAEFLHAKASERQTILSSLLGYQLYDNLHALANSRFRDHRATVTALDTTLTGYADSTDAQLAERSALADRLSDLQTWVNDAGLPALDVADAEASSAHATLAELTARHSALISVVVPDDVAALDTTLAAATAEHRAAQTTLTAAEQADTNASTAVAAFRPRFQLLTLQQQWTDLATADTELPTLTTSVAEAETALAGTRERTGSAEQTTETLRQAATDAATAAAAADAAVTATEQQVSDLAAITTPATIAELAATLADLQQRRTTVENEAAQAADAYARARGDVDTAISESLLESGLGAAATLGRAMRTDLETASERDPLAAAVTEAEEMVRRAREHVEHASDLLDEARRADIASDLRAHLHPGLPCPVCQQPVTTVPDNANGANVLTHELQLTQARAAVNETEQAHGTLDGQLKAADATRAAHLAHAEATRSGLADILTSVRAATSGDRDDIGVVIAALSSPLDIDTPTDTFTHTAQAAEQAHTILTVASAGRHTLTESLTAADRRRDAATEGRRALEHDAAAVDSDRTAAAAALNAARDTVSALSPPAVDPADLAAAWSELTTWAAQEHATRVTALPGIRDTATAASKQAADAHSRHATSTVELAQLREAESNALQELTRLSSRRDDLNARQQTLRAALSGQPDMAAVTELLAELDSLEASAAHARTHLEAARTRHQTTQTALDDATIAVTASRKQLAAARDPLTPYGAPALSNNTLASAWHELVDWATAAAKVLTKEISKAQKAADKANAAYTAAVAALSTRLTTFELPIPAEGSSAASILSAVATISATATATARAAAEHATLRLGERRRLETDRATANEKAQVANTLAQLLRSDGFRAWLLESALGSLVDDASAILFDMSSAQFELTITGKDLEVIDHNDADSHRPVRTLSGGETFQASLALALALSRQVATLAASGAAKLESIFLDEGFGTLDETSLDVVAGTLETLASSGERMVGVITHVAALAERIPVRFQVTRTGHSSTITRVGA